MTSRGQLPRPEGPSTDQISGRLVFGADASPFVDASVEVVVEDTTSADAAAEPIARVVLPAISYDGARGEGVTFAVRRAPPAQGRSHTLRVLIDVDRDGRLGLGDYHNAESVPLPSGSLAGLSVRVRRVVSQ